MKINQKQHNENDETLLIKLCKQSQIVQENQLKLTYISSSKTHNRPRQRERDKLRPNTTHELT